MSNEIPEGVELKRVTKTMHIRFSEDVWPEEGGSKYETRLCSYGPDDSDKHKYLGTVEVSYEIPTDDRFFDLKMVASLRAKKQAIIAKSRAEQTEIEAKIQSLMALENLA